MNLSYHDDNRETCHDDQCSDHNDENAPPWEGSTRSSHRTIINLEVPWRLKHSLVVAKHKRITLVLCVCVWGKYKFSQIKQQSYWSLVKDIQFDADTCRLTKNIHCKYVHNHDVNCVMVVVPTTGPNLIFPTCSVSKTWHFLAFLTHN